MFKIEGATINLKSSWNKSIKRQNYEVFWEIEDLDFMQPKMHTNKFWKADYLLAIYIFLFLIRGLQNYIIMQIDFIAWPQNYYSLSIFYF